MSEPSSAGPPVAFDPAPLPPTRWGGREWRWGERTLVMAIVNLTPDSFSGDGIAGDPARAAAQAAAAATE
ncbi:MAG TPA: hypothetical protein VFI22_02515, partial [Thermomicrobiales bacterium]|nr:hypothetical protein [Thermomicrobiales bacterium]